MQENKQQQLDQKVLEEKNEHFLKLCFNVFEKSEEGKELLEMFKDSLLVQAPVADPNKDSNFAYFREGQNHVIRSIMANVELFKEKAKG